MMEIAKTYFDDFDFDNAKIVKHPMIEQFQKNKRQFEKLLPNNFMIYFIENQEKPKSKHKITIDLTECQSKKDFVIKLSEYLRGTDSPHLQMGNLDAFNDVLFDFYSQNWLNWKDVVIVGWENFTNRYPIFSQRVLAILQDCFISCIQGHLRFANANHALETDVLPLQNKIPKIYIIVKDI